MAGRIFEWVFCNLAVALVCWVVIVGVFVVALAATGQPNPFTIKDAGWAYVVVFVCFLITPVRSDY